jgi:hypothetical protein
VSSAKRGQVFGSWSPIGSVPGRAHWVPIDDRKDAHLDELEPLERVRVPTAA